MKKFFLIIFIALLFAVACHTPAPQAVPDSSMPGSPQVQASIPVSEGDEEPEPSPEPEDDVEDEPENESIPVIRSNKFIFIDGMPILFHAYEANDLVLMDLFEVASVLSGTEKQFFPEWNNSDETPYLVICSNSSASELDLTRVFSGTQIATPTEIDVSFDENQITIPAFSVADFIYFNVNEIASMLDLVVYHEPAENRIDIFTSQMLASVIKREADIDPMLPMVALTFDDGPGDYTGQVLDILEQYNVVATFYVIGRQVERHSDTVLRAFDMGCEIANHTWSHWSLDRASDEGIRSQLRDTNAAIEAVTGVSPTSMRPPFGNSSANVRNISGELDLAIVFWSIDPSDYLPRSADRIYDFIMDSVRDRDIILLHDVYDRSVEATRRLIPALINSGFQLVTVSELMYYSGINPNPGSSYSHGR